MFPEFWSEDLYLSNNEDVAKAVANKAYKNGFEHFLKHGHKELHRISGWIPIEKNSDFDITIHPPKINYVMATWSGKRRKGNDKYNKDAGHYIKEHIASLQRLKMTYISQITIAIPFNKKEPMEFTDAVNSIPKKIGNIPVVLFRRPNRGQSYGSYSDVFSKYREEFNYYIFIEDDYIFSKDNFGSKMVTEFNKKSRCGFLCSLLATWGQDGLHAAISNGISSFPVLDTIFRERGKIPYGKHGKDVNNYCPSSQLEFSFCFTNAGFMLHDMTDLYCAPFNDAGRFVVYGDGKKDHIIIPVQFLSQLLEEPSQEG